MSFDSYQGTKFILLFLSLDIKSILILSYSLFNVFNKKEIKDGTGET